jgi:hypothetical protein
MTRKKETPSQREPSTAPIGRFQTSEDGVEAKAPTAEELAVGAFVSDAMRRGLDKLISDDELEATMRQVKLDALSRTLNEEHDSAAGNLRGAVLPLTWGTTSGTAVEGVLTDEPRIHQYIFTFTPFEGMSTADARRTRRFVSRRIPRKLMAAFVVGAGFGGLFPAAAMLFNSVSRQYLVVWTVAFALMAVAVVAGVFVLSIFAFRSLDQADSVDFSLASRDGGVAVHRTSRRVGTPSPASRPAGHLPFRNRVTGSSSLAGRR